MAGAGRRRFDPGQKTGRVQKIQEEQGSWATKVGCYQWSKMDFKLTVFFCLLLTKLSNSGCTVINENQIFSKHEDQIKKMEVNRLGILTRDRALRVGPNKPQARDLLYWASWRFNLAVGQVWQSLGWSVSNFWWVASRVWWTWAVASRFFPTQTWSKRSFCWFEIMLANHFWCFGCFGSFFQNFPIQ